MQTVHSTSHNRSKAYRKATTPSQSALLSSNFNENGLYILTEEDRLAIAKAERNMDNGLYVTHEDAMKSFEQCLLEAR